MLQPKYQDQDGVPKGFIKSAIIRNVSKGVKLFDLLVTLIRTDRTSEGDVIIWVCADPTSFNLPCARGSQHNTNPPEKITPIRIPRYLPLFEQVAEKCFRNIGRVVYITSVSLLESTDIIFNERTTFRLWKIRNGENKEPDLAQNSSGIEQLSNSEGLVDRTNSPIEVPTVALPISSQPYLTASTYEILKGLQEPSRNPSPPIEVPTPVLPSQSKHGFIRDEVKNQGIRQNFMDELNTLPSLPPLEDCLYELATKTEVLAPINETHKSVLSPRVVVTKFSAKQASLERETFSVNSCRKRARPVEWASNENVVKKSNRLINSSASARPRSEKYRLHSKDADEPTSQAKCALTPESSMNLHFRSVNALMKEMQLRVSECYADVSRAEKSAYESDLSSVQIFEENWTRESNNMQELSPNKNSSPACEFEGSMKPTQHASVDLSKSVESSGKPEIPPYIPPDETQDTTSQLNRKPLLNLFIPSPRTFQKQRMSSRSCASSEFLLSSSQDHLADELATTCSNSKSINTRQLTKLTALSNDLSFTSLSKALKFCKERLRNLHLWCNKEELKKLKTAPRFYPNLKEPFNVKVRVRVLSERVDDLVKQYCRDCHFCVNSKHVEAIKPKCRHLRREWKWFAKLKLSDMVGVIIEVLLVGSDSEEFFCGITAEQLKKSNRGRVIVENFIAAIESSKCPLDIGLLAVEDDNGDILWLVKRTQGRLSV